MRHLMFLSLIGGAVVLAAAALLRPVPALTPVAENALWLSSPAPATLRGRPRDPIPLPGDDLESALHTVREAQNAAWLEHWAVHADDARVRRDAAVRLVALRGARTRPFLRARVADEAESLKVRAACARLLGRAGTLADLESILDGPLPRRVRAGAAAGLVALGEEAPNTAGRLDSILRGPCQVQRTAVVDAIAEMRNPFAECLAMRYAEEPGVPPASRARLVRLLGATRVAASVFTLRQLAVDATAPTEVRIAAADALGVLGLADACSALEGIDDEAPLALRRSADHALQRIARREVERR